MERYSPNDTAREAKAIVALAFRQGPIEDVHAGTLCPRCNGSPDYSRIADSEMKEIMKHAVDETFRLLRLKSEDPAMYESEIRRGGEYAAAWDEPRGAPAAKEHLSQERVQSRFPAGGVLLTIPLSSIPTTLRAGQSFEEVRNRLENLIGYIGLLIEKRGFATAHESGIERNRLNLLLAGCDTAAISRELQAFLYLFKLPEQAKLVVFGGDSFAPVEIELGTPTKPTPHGER